MYVTQKYCHKLNFIVHVTVRCRWRADGKKICQNVGLSDSVLVITGSTVVQNFQSLSVVILLMTYEQSQWRTMILLWWEVKSYYLKLTCTKWEILFNVIIYLQARYRLCAVLLHHGSSSQAGHYTATVRNGQHWTECNDLQVPLIAIFLHNEIIIWQDMLHE